MKNILLIVLLVSLGISADVKIGGTSYFDYTNADYFVNTDADV